LPEYRERHHAERALDVPIDDRYSRTNAREQPGANLRWRDGDPLGARARQLRTDPVGIAEQPAEPRDIQHDISWMRAIVPLDARGKITRDCRQPVDLGAVQRRIQR
jgi:hypothetical protein